MLTGPISPQHPLADPRNFGIKLLETFGHLLHHDIPVHDMLLRVLPRLSQTPGNCANDSPDAQMKCGANPSPLPWLMARPAGLQARPFQPWPPRSKCGWPGRRPRRCPPPRPPNRRVCPDRRVGAGFFGEFLVCARCLGYLQPPGPVRKDGARKVRSLGGVVPLVPLALVGYQTRGALAAHRGFGHHYFGNRRQKIDDRMLRGWAINAKRS